MPRKNRSGIDPGTLRLVAQCLNHYATPGPGIVFVTLGKTRDIWRPEENCADTETELFKIHETGMNDVSNL